MLDRARPALDLDTVDKLLTTTRAVRKRLDLTRPVELAVILECLRLAVQAPTGYEHADVAVAGDRPIRTCAADSPTSTGALPPPVAPSAATAPSVPIQRSSDG